MIVGVALSVAHHLRREQRLVFEHWTDAQGLHFKPQGVLWFGSAYTVEEEFAKLLAQYPEATDIKLHLGGLGRIDLSAAIMFKQLMEDGKVAGLKVELLGRAADGAKLGRTRVARGCGDVGVWTRRNYNAP